ncbi:MAG: TlpA disulfide reductase family protein [Rhizobiaceae bacterium]
MAETFKGFPSGRAVLLSVLAGAAAGAVAVYVSIAAIGNNRGENGGTAGEAVVATEADAACAGKAAKARSVGEAATGHVAALLAADPPSSLRKLAFNAPDGAPMTVADRDGRMLLLNLWATWCAPCRAEMPSLDALQKEMGSDRFEVVAVNVDTGDDEKPRKFLAETGVQSLGYYRDNTLALFNELKKRGLALGLPATLLIDHDGCLLANMNGPAEWSSPDAKRLISAALGG